ncbi:putative type IX secretion system sortase PorU2 [Dyadobacter sp. MSC1_007]|jgi:hypothetical protein|uniref:putative type IX secretion system sortase PorU2 n=1 Tax=Dyadobacter sp. MSC1_007 TaxID=2909264 RepID=UPI002030CF90|nr:C25 family cysteine peptidase [Dyadobacter sp. MSC1_007]
MNFKKAVKLTAILVLLAGLVHETYAQWGAPYTNNWIVYGKPYVKIGVTQKGIHKLPFSTLPSGFPVNDVAKLQLWHRGRQVAILSTDNNEVQFYGVPNDGASDSLLYRPMSSRINPYWSMYSDESAYFLTVGDAAGLRAERVNRPVEGNIPVLSSHIAAYPSIYKNEYSLSTTKYLRPSFFSSYFEIGASRTGAAEYERKAANYPFQLLNPVSNSSYKPTIKLLVHGRSGGNKNIEIRIGKNDQSLRLVHSIANNGFEGSEYSFEIAAGDLDEQNKGVLNLRAVGTNEVDAYSLAYYTLSYTQLLDMKGKNSNEFGLPKSSEALSRLAITNTPVNATILDLSDLDKPKVIGGEMTSLMVPRVAGKALPLYVTNEAITVQKAKVNEVTFTAKHPTSPNYIIVTNDIMLDAAKQYAAYRATAQGGGYKPLVVTIKDLYNQFNYGEPSPLAIRRFVDYMLSDANKDKYLYLIGKSITFNERMIRELPDEVPTIGFPASDVLLVEGLAGVRQDLPAIPVGRLSAINGQQVLDYLQKVKEYENSPSGEYGWRKNFLHLNGGKTVAEITQLKNLLASLVPKVSDGIVGGKVTPFVKRQAIGEVETVNITPEVNAGVGLITYFGHGSTTVTDLDMGYSTDPNRGYKNATMYPMMYFNGCGVGNIFSARFNSNPAAGDRYPLSLDWLLTPQKGAIAIIANSFESFVSPSSRYLNQLYTNMFTDSSTFNLSIGKIQAAVAKKIIQDDPSLYNVQNIHQSVLQGDPALRPVTVQNADYAVDADQGIKIYSESPEKTIGNSQKVKVNVILENRGRYIKTEKIPVEITYYYTSSQNPVKQTVSGFAYYDTLSFTVPTQGQIERIAVKIDPAKTLKELNENNNNAELVIEWEVAKNETIYPAGSIKDVIAPLLDVRFNGRMIKNDEVIASEPIITLRLEDDRFLSGDTTRINVFLKSCEDNTCDFERINYSGSMQVTSLSDHVIQVTLNSTVLKNQGKYELLVTATDDAGNASVLPYQIRFEIGESQNFGMMVSPNPASQYVRFEARINDAANLDAIEWEVFNAGGTRIYSNQSSSISKGINEWYWQPGALASGMYYYKVRFKGKNSGESKELTGKLILVK